MAGGGGGEEGDFGFQIAPMVDVVFVLMLFFMACVGSQITELELTINLPSGTGAAKDRPGRAPIIIDIGPDGSVSMNSQGYGAPGDRNLEALRQWFKDTIARFGADDPVIIRPAPEARHERIIDVLNAAAASGVKNLTFS